MIFLRRLLGVTFTVLAASDAVELTTPLNDSYSRITLHRDESVTWVDDGIGHGWGRLMLYNKKQVEDEEYDDAAALSILGL